MNQKIINYLQKNKDKFGREKLVKALVGVGYKLEDINHAVDVVYKQKNQNDVNIADKQAEITPKAPLKDNNSQQANALKKQSAKKPEGKKGVNPEGTKQQIDNKPFVMEGGGQFIKIKNPFLVFSMPEISLQYKLLLGAVMVKVLFFILGTLQIAFVTGFLVSYIGGVPAIPYDVLYAMSLFAILKRDRWAELAAVGISILSVLGLVISRLGFGTTTVISINGNSPLTMTMLFVGFIFDLVIIYAGVFLYQKYNQK